MNQNMSRRLKDPGYLKDDTKITEKLKIGILSLGCPRNLVDSESILSRLNLKGYPIVDLDKADIGIINTCAFIDDAKAESIEAILDLVDWKIKGKLKKIIVYGCLVQRFKDDLIKELSQIDAFVGRVSLNHDLRAFSITPRHYAYLKICEGCINNCSYCIIPKIKGRFTSLDLDTIIDRVEKFDQDGISEVNIIGQDITGYGTDLYGSAKLTEILKSIVKKARNIGWLRLLYLYPSRITDELVELISTENKICKYVDLPIQHINDRILKLMHRRTTKKDILGIIDKIRKRIPGVAIRTSLIVGFPSETDREFKELTKFIEDIKFERLGAFIYSREEGTKAFNLKGQLSKKIKMERLNAIMLTQQNISEELNKKFLGRSMDILIDEEENSLRAQKDISRGDLLQERLYLGRSQYDAPEVDGVVYVHSRRALKSGDFVKVRVTDTLEYDLVGEVIR